MEPETARLAQPLSNQRHFAGSLRGEHTNPFYPVAITGLLFIPSRDLTDPAAVNIGNKLRYLPKTSSSGTDDLTAILTRVF